MLLLCRSLRFRVNHKRGTFDKMKELKTTWTGIRPIILHNGQLADPLNKYSRMLKNVTSKRKKTDADHEEMARIEFEGGLYWDEKVGVYLPSDGIEATICAGAKKSRIGKDVQAAVFVQDEIVPLIYDGPKTIEALWKDRHRFVLRKPVKVGQAKVMRTRPMFPTGWSVSFTLEYDEDVVNESALKKAMIDAGSLCGCFDWRPKFGRFIVS